MEDLKLAILIDADNISPKYVKVIPSSPSSSTATPPAKMRRIPL